MRLMQEPQTASTLIEYNAATVAHHIVDVATDKKASDILLLDIRRITTLADYFVILTGSAARQIRALANNIEEALDKEGIELLGREGMAEDGWVLLDYGQVVVHIFSPEQRAYYGLEDLWRDAITVVRIQ
jgi:ribosome-associated protein